MIDHAPRIRARKQQAAEDAAMNELASRVLPFQYAVKLALFLIVCGIAVDGWNKYADMAAQNEALVQCINGQAIGMGSAVMRCNVREYKLVGEVKS